MDDKHTGRHAGTDAAADEGDYIFMDTAGGDVFFDKAATDELSNAELDDASGGRARAKNPDDKSTTEDGRLSSF